MQGDIDAVAVAHRGFVHSIVHHFPDQLMKPCRASVADIHSGAFADRLQPLQNFYFVSPVAVAVGRLRFRRREFGKGSSVVHCKTE